MADLERPPQRDRIRWGLLSLDMLDAASSAATPEDAARCAREMAPLVLEGLAEGDAPNVLAALAVMAVWQMPPMVEPPRFDHQIRFRLAQVRSYVKRYKLELTWLAS